MRKNSSARVVWNRVCRESCENFNHKDFCFRGVKERYDDVRRKYHTLKHVDDMLGIYLPKITGGISPALFFATMYHDSVMEFKPDDVKNSAEFAFSHLSYMGFNDVPKVQNLIHITGNNFIEPVTEEEMAIYDADRAILGQMSEDYDIYANQIMREYDCIPFAKFCKNRISFLKTLIKRPHIYYTSFAREQWEEQARKNISREISELQKMTRVVSKGY